MNKDLKSSLSKILILDTLVAAVQNVSIFFDEAEEEIDLLFGRAHTFRKGLDNMVQLDEEEEEGR